MPSYVTGVVAAAFFSNMPANTWLVIGLLLCVLLLILVTNMATSVPALGYVKSVLLFSLGLSLALLQGQYQLSQRFDDTRSNRICVLQGVVSGLPINTMSYHRFELTLDWSRCGDVVMRMNKVQLSDYRQQQHYRAGEVLRVVAKLKTPRGNVNERGFDLTLWALQNDIDASGYVKRIEQHLGWRLTFSAWRERIRYWLLEKKLSAQVTATLQALLIGDKSALSESQWQTLRVTGTVHLLVVSGLHIAIVTGLSWWFFITLIHCARYFGCASCRSDTALIGALIISFIYLQLAGAGLSTQRAWLMALIMLIGQRGILQYNWWQRWWMALCVIVTLQPLSVLSPGLWMSFIAVAALISLGGLRRSGVKYWLLLRTQLWVWLALLPLMIGYFQQLSLLSPFINMIAIPLMGFFLALLTPVLLLSYFHVEWPLQFSASLLDGFWWFLKLVSQYGEYLVIDVAILPVLNVFATALCCVLLLLPISRVIKIALIVTGCLLLQPKLEEKLAVGQFSLQLFDVGQGLAVAVHTREKILLFDTGAAFSSGFSYVDAVVEPYLRQRQIKVVDLLVVSHADNDHAGGVEALSDAIAIKQIHSGMPERLNDSAQSCESLESWQWNGVDFSYRHPQTRADRKSNDRSCALEVSSKGCSVLLLGDAGNRIERKIVFSDKASINRILLLGHHGSNSSSSLAFLKRLNLNDALASSGYNNRYSHPHPKVLERLSRLKIRLHRTDLEGAITVNSSVRGCEISSRRQNYRRYWHAMME